MRLVWVVILIAIIVSVSIGIFLNIATLTEETTLTKKTVIYDIYQNKVIYSEKDTDRNDINKVKLLRVVYTFDSWRVDLPIEYYYSNVTIIFSEKELHPANVQCSGGTILLSDRCLPWYSLENLEIGETKRIVFDLT